MKVFARNFFVGNWISNKRAIIRGPRKRFEFSFWSISRNLCIFMEFFAWNFFVGNWILNKRAIIRGPRKLFEFNFWSISWHLCICMKFFARNLFKGYHQEAKKTFQIQFLVNKLKSMHFYQKLHLEILCRKLNFEQTSHHQGSEKTFQIQFLVNKLQSMHFYETWNILWIIMWLKKSNQVVDLNFLWK